MGNTASQYQKQVNRGIDSAYTLYGDAIFSGPKAIGSGESSSFVVMGRYGPGTLTISCLVDSSPTDVTVTFSANRYTPLTPEAAAVDIAAALNAVSGLTATSSASNVSYTATGITFEIVDYAYVSQYSYGTVVALAFADIDASGYELAAGFTGGDVVVGGVSGSELFGAISFNAAGQIPAESTVSSATLDFYVGSGINADLGDVEFYVSSTLADAPFSAGNLPSAASKSGTAGVTTLSIADGTTWKQVDITDSVAPLIANAGWDGTYLNLVIRDVIVIDGEYGNIPVTTLQLAPTLTITYT